MDYFDKAQEELTLSPDDIAKTMGNLNRTDMLYDILLAMGGISIILHTTFFLFTFFGGKKQVIKYVPYLGYAIIMVVIIYTARYIYTFLDNEFREKCEGNHQTVVNKDYIIESDNRFYSISSFMYYYVKTYVLTIINIIIVSIFIYLFFIFLHVIKDIHSEDTYCYKTILQKYIRFNDIFYYIYMVIAAIITLFTVVQSVIYAFSYYLGNHEMKGKEGSGQTARGLSAMIIILFVLFLPGILYYIDLYTDKLGDQIKKKEIKTIDPTTKKEKIMYPLIEMYKINIFKFVDFRKKEMIKNNVRIFIYGFIISMIFSFFLLPKFDVERYCNLGIVLKMRGDSAGEEARREFDYLHTISRQYGARFKFGYFVMIAVVLFMHIWEFSIRGLFEAIWVGFALKNKTGDFESNSSRYINIQDESIKKNKELLLNLYKETYNYLQKVLTYIPYQREFIDNVKNEKGEIVQNKRLENIFPEKIPGNEDIVTEDDLELSKDDLTSIQSKIDIMMNDTEKENTIEEYPPGLKTFRTEFLEFIIYDFKDESNERIQRLKTDFLNRDNNFLGKTPSNLNEKQQKLINEYYKGNQINCMTLFLQRFNVLKETIKEMESYYETEIKRLLDQIKGLPPKDEDALKLWKYAYYEQKKMLIWIKHKFEPGFINPNNKKYYTEEKLQRANNPLTSSSYTMGLIEDYQNYLFTEFIDIISGLSNDTIKNYENSIAQVETNSDKQKNSTNNSI